MQLEIPYSFGNAAELADSPYVSDSLQASLKRNQHLSGRVHTEKGFSYYKIVPLFHYYQSFEPISGKVSKDSSAISPFGIQIRRRALGCVLLASEKPIDWLCYSVTKALLSEYSGAQNFVTKLSIVNSLDRLRADTHLELLNEPLRNFQDFDDRLGGFAEKIAHSLVHVTQAQSAAIRLYDPFSYSLKAVAISYADQRLRDPIIRRDIPLREGMPSLNGFTFQKLRQGEHAYIPDLHAQLPSALVGRGLIGLLPSSSYAKSEFCVPVLKNGLTIGTIDLESASKQAFDMDIQFCHQMAEMLGEYIGIVDRSSDAGWLPRLSYFQYASHRIEKVRREVSRNSSAAIQTTLDFIAERLSPNYIDPHKDRKVRFSALLAGVRSFIQSKEKAALSQNSEFFTVLGSLPTSLPAKVAHSLQVILENILENADVHDGFSGNLTITCSSILQEANDGVGLRKLAIQYRSRKARFFASALSLVGIAPRWEGEDNSYHLGMFLVGVHVRLLGGTMWLDRSTRGSNRSRPFRLVIEIPLTLNL
jgi:hypothetical protein